MAKWEDGSGSGDGVRHHKEVWKGSSKEGDTGEEGGGGYILRKDSLGFECVYVCMCLSWAGGGSGEVLKGFE